MDGRVLTAKDLELFYSGMAGHPFLNLGDIAMLIKGTGAVTTDLAPQFFNTVYGAQIWAQINMEANAFAALPKTTWPRTGWRVIKSLSTTPTDIAISQTGALPNPVHPEVEVVKAPPKVEALTFEVSEVIEELAGMSADDIYGNVNQVRMWYGTEFAKMLNKQLLYKAIGNGADTSLASAGNMLESIDRIISSYSESQINNGESGVVGAASDVYGIDRHSAASWADSVVIHNNGSDQELTDELIRDLIRQTTERGAKPTFFLTGYDTFAKLNGLYMTYARWLNPLTENVVQFGTEGVKTAGGTNVGLKVAALYDIPVIQAVDTPKDTISRIYLIDSGDPEGNGLPRAGISVVRPIEYFETRDYILLNKFVIKGAYRFIGETVFRGLAYQGKLRDLS